MRKESSLLIFLITLLFIINYNWVDNALKNFLDESEFGIVERIVDGDTLIINGNSTRLIGINTPEKGEKYYSEAKKFLEELLLNRTIKIEYGKEKYDKYGRRLAYIFLEDKNINVEIVKNGFANIYIYNNDEYTLQLKQAWNYCIEKKDNLCSMSYDKCAECIKLKELDYKNQKAIFYNNCSFICNLTNWTIKDEGRKKFIFPNFMIEGNKEIDILVENGTDNENVLFWRNEEYVWTLTGDTLFLRDKDGELVLWKSSR